MCDDASSPDRVSTDWTMATEFDLEIFSLYATRAAPLWRLMPVVDV